MSEYEKRVAEEAELIQYNLERLFPGASNYLKRLLIVSAMEDPEGKLYQALTTKPKDPIKFCEIKEDE